MDPATRNFNVVESDTFEATITLRDKATGDPINLTGATCKMQVRTSYDAVDPPAMEFTTGGGGMTVDGVNGKITLSKTVALAAGEYVYDLQVVFAGPITRTYLRGRIKVLEEVTT
jgi:hypothetical protein